MTKLKLLAAILVLTFLGSCVPSVHPLYGDDDLRFEEALLGVWQSDESDTWTFTKRNDAKAYSLTIRGEDGKTGHFVAHLVEVKGLQFLDLFPEDDGLDGIDYYKGHFIPVHTFLRVRGLAPTLALQSLDPDWLDELLEKNSYAIAHERTADTLLLTAPTKALQAFLKKHDQNEKAWTEVSVMRRARDDENPSALGVRCSGPD